MPSRRQRRRREKLKRHEYEYVLETEEGEEIVLERPRPDESSNGKAAKTAAPRDRRGREIPKPSMGRVLRRTAIFAPLILVVVFLTSGAGTSTGAKIYSSVLLLLFFIPFSYLVDVVMYRMLSRRAERHRSSKG
jgi:hypothetical protein